MKFNIAILLVVWGLVVASIYATGAGSQDALPEANPLITACHYAGALAEQADLAMTRCRKVGIAEYGNAALVTVQVKINGVGLFQAKVWLFRSEWAPHGALIVPEVGG